MSDQPAITAYLQTSNIIDWQHPSIVELAAFLAKGHGKPTEIAQVCFQWVRDEIRHSFDYQLNPVTCRASDVLRHRTGYCYAKSHLLAALLRANAIPTGFCYQRLSVNDQGAPYCLHGLNAVYLPEIGWYRIDPRGNRGGIDARFMPPQEKLAFSPRLTEETDFPAILPAPLAVVVDALNNYQTWHSLLQKLPDLSPEMAAKYGLWQNLRPHPSNF
ncbi:transglutaminase family protein [Leptolyngbyaceae cyanobacterium CCMR0082]|uniref:Transglutaminase family protein n=2 Tax=Adonisia turfae TaxID=2950184 RepID=A0A6M0S7D2_9CYAN|nr:transglutaminase family protein [Adonisia turfae]MDV3349499.1 transglutaminase family protein [Leptothoe sp. LEGE 181152]NEZ57673.1 transglutaminase family protein [Adonisia turfae CCMR0081]NEZ64296.1 transglutaminase family protein [Adonisia turfae CCMR0082]